jgi:hypothetical protein
MKGIFQKRQHNPQLSRFKKSLCSFVLSRGNHSAHTAYTLGHDIVFNPLLAPCAVPRLQDQSLNLRTWFGHTRTHFRHSPLCTLHSKLLSPPPSVLATSDLDTLGHVPTRSHFVDFVSLCSKNPSHRFSDPCRGQTHSVTLGHSHLNPRPSKSRRPSADGHIPDTLKHTIQFCASAHRGLHPSSLNLQPCWPVP